MSAENSLYFYSVISQIKYKDDKKNMHLELINPFKAHAFLDINFEVFTFIFNVWAKSSCSGKKENLIPAGENKI